MYTPNRLEWHQGDENRVNNPSDTCGGSCQSIKRGFCLFSIALLLLTPRAKIHQRYLRGFSFGRRNTVRQWLRLRYPDTRLARSGNVGLVLERGGEIVWDSAMRWHGSEEQYIEAQANCGCDHGKAVLCSNIHQRAVVNRRERWR
jgi:hypothetical protein